MKISVNKILFYWYTKIPKNFKSKSFQISLLWEPMLQLLVDFDYSDGFGDLWNIRVNIFGLFNLTTYYNKECDHAGLNITLNILGLDLEYRNTDIRHWDYDNKKWEELDDSINNK